MAETFDISPTSIAADTQATITCTGAGFTPGWTVAIDYRGNCSQGNPCIPGPDPGTVAPDGTFSVPWTLTLPKGTYHPFAFVSDPADNSTYVEKQTTLRVQ
jgi:hypothetical protein